VLSVSCLPACPKTIISKAPVHLHTCMHLPAVWHGLLPLFSRLQLKMSEVWEDPLWRRYMATHEAGHAVTALKSGQDIGEIVIGPSGGYSLKYLPKKLRFYHSFSALGGYFSTALYDREGHEKWANWEDLEDDLKQFNAGRMGATFRLARKEVLWTLRENKEMVISLANRLLKYHTVNAETPEV
jgi:hypothetical protein